jgi:hypothetical protein
MSKPEFSKVAAAFAALRGLRGHDEVGDDVRQSDPPKRRKKVRSENKRTEAVKQTLCGERDHQFNDKVPESSASQSRLSDKVPENSASRSRIADKIPASQSPEPSTPKRPVVMPILKLGSLEKTKVRN